MNKLWLLATNTIREVVRQKLFLNVIVFGVLMIIFAQVVANLTFGRADRVVRSIGLSGMALALDLLAVLLGVAIVHREIERKTALVVLTRPVSRGTFIAGRFAGVATANTLAAVGFAAVFVSTLLSVRGTPTGLDFLAMGGALLESWIVAAFAVLLSCITTPSLGAGVALGFIIAAASIDDVVNLTAKDGGFMHDFAVALSYVLPSFSRLNFRDAAVYGDVVPAVTVAQAVGYSAAFAAIFLVLATLALRNKELV